MLALIKCVVDVGVVFVPQTCSEKLATTYVTGSGKRDIFAQTMIFQYKRFVRRNVILFII